MPTGGCVSSAEGRGRKSSRARLFVQLCSFPYWCFNVSLLPFLTGRFRPHGTALNRKRRLFLSTLSHSRLPNSCCAPCAILSGQTAFSQARRLQWRTSRPHPALPPEVREWTLACVSRSRPSAETRAPAATTPILPPGRPPVVPPALGQPTAPFAEPRVRPPFSLNTERLASRVDKVLEADTRAEPFVVDLAEAWGRRRLLRLSLQNLVVSSSGRATAVVSAPAMNGGRQGGRERGDSGGGGGSNGRKVSPCRPYPKTLLNPPENR